MSERACGTEHSTFHPTLYLAFELGNKKWKLGFTEPSQANHRCRRPGDPSKGNPPGEEALRFAPDGSGDELL